MIPKWGARYRCLSCDDEFVGWSGPQQNKAALQQVPGAPSDPTQCRACGHLYMKWLNYEEMFPGRASK